MMRKIFKFSHFDYYLPLSEQCKQIRQLECREDIFKYSLSAILSEKPEILGIDAAYDKIFMNSIESNEIKITLNDYTNIHKIDQGRYNVLNGMENKLKLDSLTRSTNVDSFQSLWKIVNFNNDECFLYENSLWIKNQTERLIINDKIDLHHMSIIYGFLGENNGPYDFLWEYYDRLISNYILNFLPEEFLIVIKGYVESKVVDKTESKWLKILKYNLNYFDHFSINQLIRFTISTNNINFSISQLILDKIIKEAENPNDPYHLYIMIKYNKFKLPIQKLKEILASMPINSKFYLAEILSKAGIEDSSFELILDSILSEQGPHKIEKIYDLSKIILQKNSFFNYLHKLIEPLTPLIDTFTIFDYKKFLELLCILKNADYSFSEDFLEKMTKKFYEFEDRINYQNFQIFTHFFTYSMPVKAIHKILCQKILDNEKNDVYVKNKPRHEYYYKNSEGLFVVFQNDLLENLTFTSMIDVLICLKFRYQVTGEVNSVLKKYIKLIFLNYDYKLGVKFRSKFAIMLAIPENFDRELITLLLDRINRNTKLKNAMMQSYPFMQAIKSLKNIDYEHQAFKSMPLPNITKPEVDLSD